MFAVYRCLDDLVSYISEDYLWQEGIQALVLVLVLELDLDHRRRDSAFQLERSRRIPR
jgi:hypothetical protein